MAIVPINPNASTLHVGSCDVLNIPVEHDYELDKVGYHGDSYNFHYSTQIEIMDTHEVDYLTPVYDHLCLTKTEDFYVTDRLDYYHGKAILMEDVQFDLSFIHPRNTFYNEVGPDMQSELEYIRVMLATEYLVNNIRCTIIQVPSELRDSVSNPTSTVAACRGKIVTSKMIKANDCREINVNRIILYPGYSLVAILEFYQNNQYVSYLSNLGIDVRHFEIYFDVFVSGKVKVINHYRTPDMEIIG